MNKKLVSIIVNCFNGEKYLKENLESIQRQEYSNWELIFWDNQSSDDSKKIFDSFNDNRYKFSFSNFHYYFEKSNEFKVLTNKDLPIGKVYNSLSKNYIVAISGLIIKKDLLEKINFFNPEFNIIGDFDAVMKLSKMEECFTIQKPLLSIRIHGKNFSDQHRKMYFKEFKNWYLKQKRDELFINNRFYFVIKLLRLYIIALMPKFLKDLIKKK